MIGRPRRSGGSVAREEHLSWIALTEVSGPFLTVPVLSRIWPTLEALDKPTREALTLAHTDAADDPGVWIHWVLTRLLGWGDALDTSPEIRTTVAEHDAEVAASFALRDPSTGTPALLGMTTPPGQPPTARIADDPWPATPVDRLALLCRAQSVELGLVTDGRWWALIWAPRGGVTTTAIFDSITWRDATDRVVVRAVKSLLERRRFFGVPDDQRLPLLLRESGDNQEEVTEQLGVQVRQAVELLVQAIGRDEQRAIDAGGTGLTVTASDVYRGAVTVMMRIVFLLYAEERRLLPSDSDLYETAYSAARLGDQLQQRADAAGEESLQASYTGWYRLLALFNAVYAGIDHPRLTLHAYDGSIFDPAAHPWLAEVRVDDQAVLHMLAAVQRVTINRETRTLSFRALDVEQIGYVYEGLLSFDAYRAGDVVVGLVGRVGAEEEVDLNDLDELWERAGDDEQFAVDLAATYRSSGIGTARAISKRLASIPPAAEAAARGLLAAVTAGDADLIIRLLPYYGLLRTDLRGLPVVIRPGALYVTASGLRASTGTHYTPRFLAEQVVEGALEPLIYSPGPLQTADKNEWHPRTSTEILALNVADIAMGSGAFLVAACRYLATALVEAWAREGDPRAAAATISTAEAGVIDTEVDPVVTEARRQVIEHCLYGVDINPMAVEMAKLSLWLVSMDPQRPFTFLDDRLLAGDSLLGISSLDQLEAMHLLPARGKEIHQDGLIDLTAGIRARVQQAATDREQLAGMTGESLEELNAKRAFLDTISQNTMDLRNNADLLVAASLANAGKGAGGLDIASKIAVSSIQRRATGTDANVDRVERDYRDWLDTDRPEGGFPREPFHWPIAFPEAFLNGGFDGIVGNPPFLGGKKISGVNGSAYREYLVYAIGNGVKGNADLVAYFLLRANSLQNLRGQSGLIATNTLAQGDTREVGLDQVVEGGSVIRRAVKSESWPSKSAALQYCAIWNSRAAVGRSVPRTLDGNWVREINTSLDPRSRAMGSPVRLAESSNLAFIGNFVNGIGFVIDPSEAQSLIEHDPNNRQVLRPYLNGQDLNSRPDTSASRLIIDFGAGSIERASNFPDLLKIVEERVKPARDQLPNSKKRTRDLWWQFEKLAPGLRRAISELDRVIVITLVSKVVMPVFVPTGQVFSHMLGVFATDDPAMLAFLSSAPHYLWSIERASTLETRIRYTPSDVFETLPRPEATTEMRLLGARLDSFRRSVMLSRQAGLTATYNLVHESTCADTDIAELRDIHRQIDVSVCRAYNWHDLVEAGLDHGFRETRQGSRYGVGPLVRQEILDRLLELNHERYAAEQASGAGRKKRPTGRLEQAELFG